MIHSQYFNSHRIFKRPAKALVSLGVCEGWSGPLLVAHTKLLEISCQCSNLTFMLLCYCLLLNLLEKSDKMLGKPSSSCNRTPGRPQHLGVIDLTITIIHEITVYYIIYISYILLTGFIQPIVLLT